MALKQAKFEDFSVYLRRWSVVAVSLSCCKNIINIFTRIQLTSSNSIITKKTYRMSGKVLHYKSVLHYKLEPLLIITLKQIIIKL